MAECASCGKTEPVENMLPGTDYENEKSLFCEDCSKCACHGEIDCPAG